jgi:hypothetical protein
VTILREGADTVRPDDDVLRVVIDPLPPPVERAWRAYDRIQARIEDMLRHKPGDEDAVRGFTKALVEAAMADGEPIWPSPVDVLAARQTVEAHDTTLRALYDARYWAVDRRARAIVATEPQLVEALDDRLGALQDEAALRKAAAAVPLGVGGDGLLAAGPATASQAALLGDAAGRFEQIRTARRVVFEYLHPQTAPWIAIVAEGTEDGRTWRSAYVRGEAEKPPWTGGPGGELHFAVVSDIRLRCMTAVQLDDAGYPPPGIDLQPIRL